MGRTIKETKLNPSSWNLLTNKFEKVLSENIFGRYQFIEIAGGFANLTGLRSFNGVQKMANGYLTFDGDDHLPVATVVERIEEFNDFLKERHIPFLVVLVPGKRAMFDVQLSPGRQAYSHIDYQLIVRDLQKRGVAVLDMDTLYKKSDLGIEKVHYGLDNHWKPSAALLSVIEGMEFLASKNLVKIKKDWLDKDGYELKVVPKAYLGNHGKRTGKYYAGLGDAEVFYSKIPTDYSVSWLEQKDTKWNYQNRVFEDSLLKQNLFHMSVNSIHWNVYGALQHTKNKTGFNNKKLLVLGDSYSQAWQYFASPQFKEMDYLHMLLNSDTSAANYVIETKPDIVVMVINSDSLAQYPNYLHFGIDRYLRALKETKEDAQVQLLDKLEVLSPPKQKSKFEFIPFKIIPGRTYTMTVESIKLSGGMDLYVHVSLHNLTANRSVANRYFDANSDKQQKWIFTVPQNANETFALYAYAGVKGQTIGAEVLLEGIRLKEGIEES